MRTLSASIRAAAWIVGLALLMSAAPASAEIVDLFNAGPTDPAIGALLAGASPPSSPAVDIDGAAAGADRDAGGATSSPIPEPGAWALLLLGFLALGLGMYNKRKPRLSSVAD